MATETTDQVVERLAIKLLDDLFGGCEYSNNPKQCDKCSPSVAQIEAALREALRIGREQAESFDWKLAYRKLALYLHRRDGHNQFYERCEDPRCNPDGAPIMSSAEADAIRNLSTEE